MTFDKSNFNILVGCEESQKVTKKFRELGYNAFSCDLLEPSGELKEFHFQEDIKNVINYKKWDALIAFPPCTYLSNVGAQYFNVDKFGDKALSRLIKRLEAKEFVAWLYNQEIKHIAIENPVGFLNNNWMKPSQIIEPFYFGEPERKRTCLWLKNLPKLIKTNVVEPTPYTYFKSGKKIGKPIYRTEYISGSVNRSKTFDSIAFEMAQQWNKYFEEIYK